VDQERKTPGLAPEIDLEKLAEDLGALRVDTERKLGRALAAIHFAIRRRDRERRENGGAK